MAKRIKKSAVPVEVRRDWLRRLEEKGESPPQIAKADGYDVRTIRTQIELAFQEREAKEARVMVLRDALQKHYEDLYTFAKTLDSNISWPPTPISSTFGKDPIWQAIREHLPRSPIWKAILRWDQLSENFDLCLYQIEEYAKKEAEIRKLDYAKVPGEIGLSESFTKSIVSDVLSYARGEKGLRDTVEFTHQQATENGLHDARMGFIHLGLVNHDDVDQLQATYFELLNNAIKWEKADELTQIVAELGRLSILLHDELAIIILRRVIPGRCRYCPI